MSDPLARPVINRATDLDLNAGHVADHSTRDPSDDSTTDRNAVAPTPDFSGTGYVGVGSPDDQARETERAGANVNHDSDKDYHPRVAATPLGRHPDADPSLYDDDGVRAGPVASRVGFRSVEHPRAGRARAMHDALAGRKPSDLTSNELRDLSEGVGMQVNGTGDDDAVQDSDIVRALDDLAAEHPAASSVEDATPASVRS